METLIVSFIMALLLLFAAASLLAVARWRTADLLNFVRRLFGVQASIQLCNAILAVNITPKGRATYLADATFASRYLIAKVGSDANHINICTAADQPLGVVPDMTPTTDTDLSYWLPCNLFGLNEDTERMQCSAAIALGNFLVPAAAGQVAPAPGSGAGYVIGRARSVTATAGDLVEAIPTFPIKVAVFPY